jgi:8-oxo-dGTP diphosphatase
MEQTIIPNLSVDCVIFGFDSQDMNVLLVERTLTDIINHSVIFSDYTLTGNHVLVGENPDDAAVRVLNNLIGSHDIYLEQFQTFGNIDRLSRPNDQLWIRNLDLEIPDHVITVGYYSLINSAHFNIKKHGKRNVKWFPVNNIPELGYDHEHILKKALEQLRTKLKQEPIGFELLTEKFTLTQVQKLYEAILGTKLDPRNFRKKLAQVKYVLPLNEKQKHVRHKPAQYYIFNKEEYEKTRKKEYSYLI